MEAIQRNRQSNNDLPAPVNGGMRWRDPLQDFYNYQRVWEREHGNSRFVPAMPKEAKPPPEPPKAAGPWVTTTAPEEARAGEEYVYQAKAFDGIADGFTWFLEQAPPGMAVDRYTGRITWTPEDGGRVEMVLGVRSHYGKFSRQSWSICVRKAATVRPAVPNQRCRAALRRRVAAVCRMRPLPAPRFVWREAKKLPEGFYRTTTSPPETRQGAALPLRL